MSSISSQVAAGSASVSSEPGCEPSPSAKSTPTAGGFSPATGLESRSTMTCEPSQQTGYGATESPHSSSAEGSLARTSASPETAQDSKASAPDSGVNTLESLASYDPISRSWRTSQLSLFEGFSRFSETLPRSGTLLNGRIYQRAPWGRHMCDNDCSLWPTPTASMDGRGFGIPLHERSGRYKKSTVSRVHGLVLKHGWRIHPHFMEALMGFPIGWSATDSSETPSPQTSSSGSAAL